MPKSGKLTCLILSVLVCTALNCIDFKKVYADSPKPVIAFAEPAFDFGKTQEGAKVQHDFIVTNKGDADLVIQRVVAGCGCTAATALNQAIPANGEGKVSVTLDTIGMSGLQSKSVRVYSNDPVNPIMTVSLNGTVQQKVTVEPSNVLFESITRGQKEPIRKDVKISAERGGSVKIGEVESFSKYIKIENVSGDEYDKKFTLEIDSNLPLGDFRERVIVNVAGSGKSNINIPVYANVKGYLQVMPPAVSFGIISGKDPITRKLSLENKSDQAYSLKAVESSHPALSAKVSETSPGKIYSIDITLDPKKVDSDVRAEMKFKADTEIEENLSVNVYGVLPPKI